MSIPLGVSGVGDAPIKVLAVIGGAVVGGALIGWLAYLVVRAATTQKLPPRLRWVVHVLGGVASGWLVYLWLFGGGGGGLGGPGGWWGGSGDKGGQVSIVPPAEKEKETKEKDKDKEKAGQDKEKGEKREGVLRVEVLGTEALKKITGSTTFDPDRRYRLSGSPELRTLKEVKEVIQRRLKGTPPLKGVQVVTYDDSPSSANHQVTDLLDWVQELPAARDKAVSVTFEMRNKKAPVE